MPGNIQIAGDQFAGVQGGLNALHSMLQSGFDQTGPVDGSYVSIQGATAIPCKMGDADESIIMEMEGYLSDSTRIMVISTADCPLPPVENQSVKDIWGDTYTIRQVRSSPSSYMMTLKKTSI